MKKIYLVIAVALLILLIIINILLSLGKKSTLDNKKGSLFPTSIPDQGAPGQQVDQQNNQVLEQVPAKNTGGDQGLIDSTNASVDSSSISPVETPDFKMTYSRSLAKIVVEKKTPEAEQKFKEWATGNNYPQLADDPDKVVFLLPGQAPPDTQPLLDFLNIFLNFGANVSSPSNITSSPSESSPSLTPNSKAPKASTPKMTYYAQCGNQGSIPLPDGCNMCYAGCGAATAAMIASSYLGSQYDLRSVVNLYDKNNYLLGCSGSRYSDAHELLRGLGLKTTDYIVFNYEKSDTVVPQLRKYLNNGWTFFTLASFCSGGCGHYFWITNIDDKGNIWAYDPAYGKNQIPYNENSRYPYPQYRLAFGVKR